jgi:hypothetical protein
LAAGDDGGVSDGVAELADVAGPGAGVEGVEDLRGDGLVGVFGGAAEVEEVVR